MIKKLIFNEGVIKRFNIATKSYYLHTFGRDSYNPSTLITVNFRKLTVAKKRKISN